MGTDPWSRSGSDAVQFEKERQKLLNRTVSIGSILAGTLVPLFGLLDLVFKRHLCLVFFDIRLAVTILSFLVFFILKSSFGEKHPYPLGAFLALVVGSSVALMCKLDQGPIDPYYAGINLPLLGFGILLPLTLFEGICVFSTVWLSYFIPNLLVLKSNELGIFTSNNFFMISTIIIALASSQFHLYQRKRQWYTHRDLERAHRKIKNHARDLEYKVQERTQRLLQSERLAVVGQLAGGVAHDFNNFLPAILGTSELLLHTLDRDDHTRDDIESIARVGRRAAELVKQLLAFSRRQFLMPKILNLNDVILDLNKMLSRIIGEDIDLKVVPDPDLGCVMADPLQIEQIILNLIVNARDAMPDGGKLVVETASIVLDANACRKKQLSVLPGDYVRLVIRDTGKGMSRDTLSRIFEPFFTTKEKGEGTGLGLATVWGIVKQSNGEIEVTSEIGRGTTFKIYFPKVKDTVCITEESESVPIHLPVGKETILLVEDEDEVRSMTARMLEKQGYTVLQAREGKEAIRISESYHGAIDLLLTDVVMPRMNGKILADRLNVRRSNLKVLFVSGYANNVIAHQGVLNSDKSFLHKPFTLEDLSKRIRCLLENENPPA